MDRHRRSAAVAFAFVFDDAGRLVLCPAWQQITEAEDRQKARQECLATPAAVLAPV